MYPDIQFVVFDHSPINIHLKRWLATCDNSVRLSDLDLGGGDFSDFIAMRRNRVVKWFLDKTDFSSLVMLDHDHILDDSVNPLLESDIDVAGASYVRSNGTLVHDSPASIGAGCLRVSRTALEKIGAPWFAFEFNDDGTDIKQCECGFFSVKAQKAGYFPRKIGRAMHLVTVASRATKEGKAGVMFLNQLDLIVDRPSEHSDSHTHL